MMKLDNFDIYKEIPMDALLENSLFYPGAWSDGRVIKQCNTAWRHLCINCFVYSDYLMSEARFVNREMDTVCGYKVIGHRSLSENEYLNPEFRLELKPGSEHRYTDTFLGHKEKFGKFAHVVLYERDKQHKSVLFGPERFLLLYTNQEGLYTFQQLYVARGIRPKMLVLSQIWGFAGNWEDPSSTKSSFVWTLRRHKECVPEWLVVGDYQNYHGAQHLLGTEYLGIKLVGYNMFKGQGVLVRTGANGSRVSVVEYKGRKYLNYSVSRDICPVTYVITESKYSVMDIVKELTLHEQKYISEAEVLDQWVGFKKPTTYYVNGGPRPELALEIMYRSDCYPSYVDDSMTIVDAVKSLVIDKDVKFYTDRMMYNLKDALRILSDASKQQYPMLPLGLTVNFKKAECCKLIQHLERFCTKVSHAV